MSKSRSHESVEQHRINRINHLLDRLDRIPAELDDIHERVMRGNLTVSQYVALIDRRKALYIEQENKERELKEVYKIKQ